jgi:glycosyltransferase involved in cell wall biosynthesis
VLRALVDARDASSPQPRGWSWYVKALVNALKTQPDLDLNTVDHGWPGPEAAFELIGLPREARRRKADVLHVPNCFLPTRRPCPGVVTIHDLAFEEYPDDFAKVTARKYRLLTPRAARGADRVIVPSTFTRDDVIARYGVDPDTIRVIPEAPVLPMTDADTPPGPYLLAVGDLRRKKNFARLATAFAQLHANGLPHRLVIAGLDAGEAPAIRAAAGPAPVELPGYVTDTELDALIRGADVLVHPSLYEGFGLVLVEAMVRGIPVACADATALPETAAGAAVLFDPRDDHAIARAIETALADKERLATAGRERAAQLSWDATAQQTVAVYRELAP